MFGFDITSHTVLNALAFLLLGVLVGSGNLIAAPRLFPSATVLRTTMTTAVVVGLVCFVMTDPGWFGAIAGVTGVFLAGLGYSVFTGRGLDAGIKGVTLAASAAFYVSWVAWHYLATQDLFEQMAAHRASAIQSYARLGEIEKFVASNYIACFDKPLKPSISVPRRPFQANVHGSSTENRSSFPWHHLRESCVRRN